MELLLHLLLRWHQTFHLCHLLLYQLHLMYLRLLLHQHFLFTLSSDASSGSLSTMMVPTLLTPLPGSSFPPNLTLTDAAKLIQVINSQNDFGNIGLKLQLI